MSWLPSVLIAIVAGCAAWVAFQQMVIARKKLNHDLFDRRFAVYVATQDYFVACLNHSGGTQEDTSRFYNSTRAAPFLFDDKIMKLLEKTMKASIDIQIFGKYVGQDNLEDYQKFMDTYHKAQAWLAEEYGSLVATFNDAMNLSDTRAYPIASVLSIPDPRLLTNKVLRSLRLPGEDNRTAD